MHLTRFIDDQGQTHFGIDRGDGSADRLARNPLHHPIEPTGDVRPIARRLAPVDPVNIICIGLNYTAHAAESGSAVPDHPCVFMKPTTAANDPGAPIVLPACSNGPEVDYEAELAVVIGRTAKDVTERDALDYVLGFTCANDVSARWWQKRGGGGQFVRGKSFDTFCPLGPVLVTPGNGDEEIADPRKLRIRSILNSNVMQDDTTANMMFSVSELISRLSKDTTLPGSSVILTGTPEGVGFARNPPVFLSAGDEITVEIEGIGALTNPVVAAEA